MVLAPPPLPTQFPCWCRAVYSWGGESKRDLGFVEGDLIECLNAGDGSWWVGRLYRDRRTVGSFPSNFVQVMPPDFRPTNRSASPLPGSNTPSPKSSPSKSKTFRKPFEAYAKAPHYTSAKQPEVFRDGSQCRPRTHSGIAAAQRPHEDLASVPSPPQAYGYASRAPSPAPSLHHPPSHRGSFEEFASPPPPPPPPHRHVLRPGSNGPQQVSSNVSRHGSNASYIPYRPDVISRHGSNASHAHSADLSRNGSSASYGHAADQSRYTSHQSSQERLLDPQAFEGCHTPCPPSPLPPSPAGSHMTPSPLREAMDGVMEQLDQLENLGETHEGGPREPAEPPSSLWSPESFDMASPSPRKSRAQPRPVTSMGIANFDEGYESWSGASSQNASRYYGQREHQAGELPHLSRYVERMEKRLQGMHAHSSNQAAGEADIPPPPPPKSQAPHRPKSSMDGSGGAAEHKLRKRKSAYEVGGVSRTYTTKTTSTEASSGTNASSSTQRSNATVWSGMSAGAFSSTSAGSLARNTQRAQSALGMREADAERPGTPFTGVTYHSSHASDAQAAVRRGSQVDFSDEAGTGGLVQPKAPKRNIFKKIFDSAKTGVASNRGSLAAGTIAGIDSPRSSPFARSLPPGSSPMAIGATGIGNASVGAGPQAARDMGLGSGVDWVQVRRDVNRSNSLSKIERAERRDRCQMLDHPTLNPVDELYESVEGNEGVDGMPVDQPVNYQAINLSQVDKNSRFIGGLPPMTTAITLATTYVCRPYRSDVQKLRAVFTWVSEKISWEEDFEGLVDTRRVIQTKRACAEEYAVLVVEMCRAVGLQCDVVRGYLKAPGEVADLNVMPRPNHWWNAVVVDDEWRFMDCCLASPSNPKRGLYSSAASNTADFWWFLARPLDICWTHVPEHHDQQHMVPPVAHETLMNLPCACPPFFKNEFEMVDYNTSLTRIEDLEMVHIKFHVPPDVEVAAEVEVKAYSRDSDGDVFESGDVVKKRALAQAEWFRGVKRYTVKALLPGDESRGSLKIYAGKRGLMHSIKDIPHPLAFVLPIVHSGENPPYEFVTRHPTPHAQRHDIYVVQPQCQRLALNNTFVFAIRQHPSSVSGGPQSALTPSSNPGATSPIPFMRPGSAMSMNASSQSGSNPSSASGTVAGKKPAKLAIQTPGGKILRLMRKEERKGISVGSRGLSGDEDVSDGGTWETIIKCSEKGVWRGLVLADRTARWCVFAEWVCVS